MADSGGPHLYSLYEEDVRFLVNAQLGAANYLLSPTSRERSVPDARFSRNDELWKAILPPSEQLHANVHLQLDDFLLFEWFPRSPGLFHTEEGKQARAMAEHFLKRVPVPRILDTHRLRNLEPENSENSFLEIFDPYGKVSMLKGGIGCIRLRPKLLDSGQVWFAAASSTPVAHEGFPVALPDHIFQRHIDTIKDIGALRCSLKGKLQFLPQSMVELYHEYRGVPQLYLLVDDLEPRPSLEDLKPNLLISAGISFLSKYEGRDQMYASFASFEPQKPGSIDKTVEWLEEIYVKGLYGGQVVTDFDEQMARFAHATFSLSGIMSNTLSTQAVQTFVNTVQVFGDTAQLFQGLKTIEKVYIERVEKMEQNKTINIGPGATVNAPLVIADSIQDSLNILKESHTGEELRSTLVKLLGAVLKASATAPSDTAEDAARDAKHLVEEVTARKPRPEEGVRLGEKISDWAKSIGEVGKPVIELISALAPLLHS